MWSIIQIELSNNTCKYRMLQADQVISFGEWIQFLKESDEFILFFNDVLAASKYEAYFWEVKPVTQKRLGDIFEFVLVESTFLAKIKADNSDFKSYFNPGESVVAFPNLGKNAQLIVPIEMNNRDDYAHIANFVRNATKPQICAFWKRVGEEYEKALGAERKWLSTSGLGVYWLHVRIDSRPKYYQHLEYKIE